MAIAATAAHEEEIGGQRRRLLLRNGEIERFEAQYAPFGLFGLCAQFMGRGGEPQVRHVRDLVALALVGGGMSDRAADDLIASLPPSENFRLREIAQRVLGVAFFPAVLGEADKKKPAGSRSGGTKTQVTADTTPPPASAASAA